MSGAEKNCRDILFFCALALCACQGSNGLPYVFRAFNLMGRTTEHAFFEVGLEDNTPLLGDRAGLVEGNPVELLPLPDPGQHHSELPLNLTIVEFPAKSE